MSERQPVIPATIPSTIPLCGPADTLELIAGGSRAARAANRIGANGSSPPSIAVMGHGHISTLWSISPAGAVRKFTCA